MIPLGLALRFVLDSVKKSPNAKMYFFGVAALDRFKTRLKDYPQYCQHIGSIPHFKEFPPHLIEWVEHGANSLTPPSRPQGPVVPPTTSAAVAATTAAPPAPVVAPPPAAAVVAPTPTTTAAVAPNRTTAASTPATSATTSSTIVRPNVSSIGGRPSIANTTNIGNDIDLIYSEFFYDYSKRKIIIFSHF